MKIKLTILLLLNFFIFSLFSTNTYYLGNSTNFEDFNLKNLQIVTGDKGIKYIHLEDNEYTQQPETDLLLHFNSDFNDSADNYIVTEHYNNTTDKEKILGSGSAYFLNGKEIVYQSKDISMFSKGRVLGDFTIEFWLKPTIIGEDSSIFTWKGVNKVETEFIAQKLSCKFENRKLKWSFKNFFIPEDLTETDISLESTSKLIPNRWSHHTLRYNSKTGIIEYLMNGLPEDIKYSTLSGLEDKNILTPYIGQFSKSEINIGTRYRGFIDELRISESFIPEINLSKYKTTGYFETPIIDINGEEITVNSIKIKANIPSETEIKYFVKYSSIPFNENNTFDWIPLKDINGDFYARYLQIKGVYYNDGSSNLTPELSDIEIKWKDIPKPPPPFNITVTSNKNSLTLNWDLHKHLDISGYKLYFGSKSNNYEEVIDIGYNSTYTINNLVSNKIYYFSIRSYNSRSSEGDYSQEVYGRPE